MCENNPILFATTEWIGTKTIFIGNLYRTFKSSIIERYQMQCIKKNQTFSPIQTPQIHYRTKVEQQICANIDLLSLNMPKAKKKKNCLIGRINLINEVK